MSSSLFAAEEGSTKQLIKLCIGYFIFYVITGLTVKYFQGSPAQGFPGMKEFEYLVYSTLGGQLICLAVVMKQKWYKLENTARMISFAGRKFPIEYLYIIPSGICTAIVIPTTTLMYSLPISVMVAMIIMRGAVIIISRVVDELQLRQGLMKKQVRWEENVAVLFAMMAIGVHLVWESSSGGFDFIHNTAAMVILGSYIVGYSFRIYIMNYYKNTAGKNVKRDNRSFFGIEQIAAFFTIMLVTGLVFFSPTLFGIDGKQITDFRAAIINPPAVWGQAIIAGTAFGMVAFFSVFIFMFKGRTATFAGLVNRLTSLIAGTAATLIAFFIFGSKFPKTSDWISLAFILIAVGFLTMAEKSRPQAEAVLSKKEENMAEGNDSEDDLEEVPAK